MINLVHLSQALPFQLHHILFRLECLIRFCAAAGELKASQETQLLCQHGELTKSLGTKESYLDLFRGVDEHDLSAVLDLPRELIQIVVSTRDSVVTAREIEKKFILEFC